MAFSLIKDPPLVLVVDDNEAKRYTVTHLLKKVGYIVEEADTGLKGLQCAMRLKPDLVILDINLPDIDGFDVCRRIRQQPEIASVIVLQLSAEHVLSSDRVQGLDEGADAYISQPVENEELLATIKALLRMRMAEKRRRSSRRNGKLRSIASRAACC
jgi:DNA-binding response OmpR family regulator